MVVSKHHRLPNATTVYSIVVQLCFQLESSGMSFVILFHGYVLSTKIKTDNHYQLLTFKTKFRANNWSYAHWNWWSVGFDSRRQKATPLYEWQQHVDHHQQPTNQTSQPKVSQTNPKPTSLNNIPSTSTIIHTRSHPNYFDPNINCTPLNTNITIFNTSHTFSNRSCTTPNTALTSCNTINTNLNSTLISQKPNPYSSFLMVGPRN